MLHRKYKSLAAVLLCSICLSGCQKTSEDEIALASFSSSINDFTNYMKDADERINNLDINKKESVDELLSILDGMNDEIEKLDELKVPTQYTGISHPVKKAAENMSNAASYYHSAYESDTFNETDADIAYQYYQSSMKCINIIGCIIAGDEIPEDEHITVYEEVNDSHFLDKWFSNDEESETTSEIIPEAVN